MKKYKSTIFLIVYLIVGLVGVTYAWMTNYEVPEGTVALFSFGGEKADGTKEHNLYVQSKELSVDVYILEDDDETYTKISDLNELFTKNEVIPNNPVYFKMVFTNNSSETLDVALQIANMTTNAPIIVDEDTSKQTTIFDYVYFSIYDTSGYPTYYSKNPQNTYVSFADNLTGPNNSYYSSELMSHLYITPMIDEAPIELYSYFLLSRLADSTYENITLDIGYFRIVL